MSVYCKLYAGGASVCDRLVESNVFTSLEDAVQSWGGFYGFTANMGELSYLHCESDKTVLFLHPWGMSYKVQVVHKMDDEEWEYRLDCASL